MLTELILESLLKIGEEYSHLNRTEPGDGSMWKITWHSELYFHCHMNLQASPLETRKLTNQNMIQ